MNLMLRTSLAGPSEQVGNFGSPPSGAGGGELDLALIVAFVRRRWLLLASGFFIGLALAVMYIMVTPPLYTAKSMLMLDTRRLQLFERQSVMSDSVLDVPAVQSQMEVIKSDNVASSVVRDLKLDEDPEFTGNVHSFFGSLLSSVLHWGSLAADEPRSREKLQNAALHHFKDSLSVEEVGRTYVIEIGFRSLDQGKAARIANAVADAYILDQLQSKYQTTKRASTWLKDRLAELREQAITTDKAVQDFRAKNNLTGTDNGQLRVDHQLTDLSTQLIMTRSQAAQTKARLDEVLAIAKTGWRDNGALIGSARADGIIRLHSQYLAAEKQAEELASHVAADDPDLVKLRDQAAALQKAMAAELQQLAASYRGEYEAAKSRQDMLQANLDQLNNQTTESRQAQVKLRVLEASAMAYRKLYDSFLQRFVETTEQMSFPNSEARIITSATQAVKTSPKTGLVLTFAGFFGLLLSCGAGYALEHFDRVFRTARQVEDVLGSECLGVLPEIEGKDERADRPADPLPAEAIASRSIRPRLGLLEQVIEAPFSRFTETVRGIKVAGDMTNPRSSVLGVVSAVPGEGKSTVSANLAQLAAHSGARTLLIDADLRLSSLSRWITAHRGEGLVDVLEGRKSLAEVVWHDPRTSLEFLPAGIKGQVAHTNEIVASAAMERLLNDARKNYDYVVIDFPPLAPVVDAKAAASLIDAFVLVIRWGTTSFDILTETLGNAGSIRDKLLGAVLNRANISRMKQFESYKGGSYHSYYSSYVSAE